MYNHINLFPNIAANKNGNGDTLYFFNKKPKAVSTDNNDMYSIQVISLDEISRAISPDSIIKSMNFIL